jgi:hypothetical protein
MLWTSRRVKAGSRPFLGGYVFRHSWPLNAGQQARAQIGERRAVIVLRVIGWLLIVAALLALGWDFFLWIHDGHFGLSSAGRLWYTVWPRGFNFAEHAIAGVTSKSFWDSVNRAVLAQPMLLVAGVPGLLLVLIARRRRRRRFSR